MENKKKEDKSIGKKIVVKNNDHLNKIENPILAKEELSSISKGINEILLSGSLNDTINRLVNPEIYGLGNLGSSNIFDLSNSNYSKHLLINDEINDLKKKLIQKTKEVEAESSNKVKQEEVINELKTLLTELQKKEKINHILPRVIDQAQKLLLDDPKFSEKFEDGRDSQTVVVSIDIRRSTELMLKARKPQLFSKFITELSRKLSDVIVSNFGVFDKFTGDGILAFFPEEYSGPCAIIRAIKAAEECHQVFKEHYFNSRECFNVFIKDVGLGIGIDYGSVTLVNSGNELTVVGIPVVYACRMSGAKAGQTLLNQPAKEEIEKIINKDLKIIESNILIKNEGEALAYEVELTESMKKIEDPDWTNIDFKFSSEKSKRSFK